MLASRSQSSWLADRLPAICGSATLIMVVSRISMNAASVTVTAISHGFAAGFQFCWLSAIYFGPGCAGVTGAPMPLIRRDRVAKITLRRLAFFHCSIRCRYGLVGSTERPRGSICQSFFFLPSLSLSIMILTGTRCTILTKLPVAFSAGKALKREPDPIWMVSTWPVKLRSG